MMDYQEYVLFTVVFVIVLIDYLYVSEMYISTYTMPLIWTMYTMHAVSWA